MIEDLRKTLAQYAHREIDLDALEDWVVSHLQVILDSHDQESIGIANALDTRFVELGEGLISEDEFFNEAQALLPDETVVLPVPQVVSVASVSGSVTVQSDNSTEGVHPVWSPA